MATDYLNHFNEVVMVLELIPDMPDMIEDAETWRPASYVEHFAASGISDKDLAIWAYENAPREYVDALEDFIAVADRKLLDAIAQIKAVLRTASEDELRNTVSSLLTDIKAVLDRISAIINGTMVRLDQSQIDVVFQRAGG
ncbi:MAG: hypothetical protein HQ481_15505 [Alphaproteobacteria bacterium]|nr:hypothetical protein [Alphaproteobacteria bacterium]